MALPPNPNQSSPLSQPATCPNCGSLLPDPSSGFCMNCGSQTGSLVPPTPADPAATPVPAPTPAPMPTAVDSQPTDGFSIGIWGTKSAGKTMYLGMLRINIMRQHQPTWTMHPWNESARRFIRMVDRALADHRFTEPNLPDQPDNLWFQISKRDPLLNRDQTYSLRVLDMPGEWYQFPENAVINGVNVLEEYLANCQGLLCLVDPDSNEQDRLNIYLSDILSTLYLNKRQRVDKWFAFCMTKMDLPVHRKYLQNPAPYIKQKLGHMLIDNLNQYCVPNMISFDFACSSVGFYPGISPVRSNSGIDWRGKAVIYETDKIQPFGLLEPLEWLFKHIKPQ